MRLLPFLLLLPFGLTAQPNQLPDLSYVRETDSVFTTVESVGYDSLTGFLYTTNINGHFLARDGNGSIGRMSPDGRRLDPNWVTGLDAPTGICFYGEKLYTTDIDRLVEIDLATATVSRIIPIPGAVALNDLTVSPEGVLYLTDTGGNQIFVVEDGRPALYLNDVETPNGIVYDKGVLFVTLWTPRELIVVNTQKKVFRLHTGIPQSDGLQLLPNGDFLIASWGGAVYHLTRSRFWGGQSARSGMVTQLLHHRGEGVRTPDVCYVPELERLFVPTFGHHRLRTYALGWRSNANDPYLLPATTLAGQGLRRVTNPADPERELYQQQLFQGEEIAVYVVASETKTATYEDHPIDEFLFVLGGRARLRAEGVQDRFFYPNQHFLVPQGYRGEWETQGADGMYYELSVVARGDSSFAASTAVQSFPPQLSTAADTLAGRKLRAYQTLEPVGTTPLETTREQLIQVLTGVVRLSDQSGRSWTFRRGDFFLLPTGLRGNWRVVAPQPLRCLRVERRR